MYHTEKTAQGVQAAKIDFFIARLRADLERIKARLTGKSADLLPFDEIQQKLKPVGTKYKGLMDIPLDSIVGSVGRYADFTRSFLPRHDSDIDRWSKIEMAATSLTGLPPITAYQIGEAYFVLDGNHRVSVARNLNAPYIEGYVTEIQTKVPLSPDVQPDELIHMAEYAEFLEKTGLDNLQPEANLSVTAPGRYQLLTEQIEQHYHTLTQQQGREFSYPEAVNDWYNEVYLPIVRVIRGQNILKEFPGRTETDLYVWISQHRLALEKELGWDITSQAVLNDLVVHFSPKLQHLVTRLGEKLLDTLTPDELEAGPAPGQWRRELLPTHYNDRLFSDILVPVENDASSWPAVDQALIIARCEGGRLHGLHVVSSKKQRQSQTALNIQAQFNQRCQAAGIPGELVIEVGVVERIICERARWVDLVVVNSTHPPDVQPLGRLKSGLGTVLRRCSRPVLAVPAVATPLSKGLLAYDGSPKAEEALFVATYLARRWQTSLTIVSVIEQGKGPSDILAPVEEFLADHNLQAEIVKAEGEAAAQAILNTAQAHDCDFIMVGGYGFSPVLEIVLGSTVDQLLRQFPKPLLICR